jgi:amino acid adenylation domain-containing protein
LLELGDPRAVDDLDSAIVLSLESTAHREFASVVASTPSAVALRTASASTTYSELARSAGVLASLLASAGVSAGDRVGIVLRSPTDQVLAIFAALRLNAVYVPLDHRHPHEYIRAACSAAGVSLLLGDEPNMAVLDGCCPSLLAFPDSLDAAVAPPLFADPGTSPDDLAYVIFTSGTTGVPKGVEVTHRGIVALCRAFDALMRAHKVDSILRFAALSFDASVAEIFPALLTGRTLVTLELDPHQTAPHELIDHALHEGVDMMTLPPAYLMTADPDRISEMTPVLLVAGERCPPELVRRYADRTALYNAYGPTEVTVAATVARCSPEDADDVPIGIPLEHIDVAVLIDDREVEPGQTGELHIGGPSLARGYAGAPALTEAAFREIARPGRSTTRMYVTGDMVRTRDDGQLVFVGRSDRQVKIRGHRIELAAVEAALLELPGIYETIVLATDAHRLVAFVRTDQNITSSYLRDRLAERLPEASIPTRIVAVDEWPTTVAGKIDHAALLATDAAPESALRREQRDVREAVNAAWCAVLALDRLTVDTNFFDAGGTSIAALELVARIQESTGISIKVRDVFAFPLLGDFAEVVRQAETGQGSRRATPNASFR